MLSFSPPFGKPRFSNSTRRPSWHLTWDDENAGSIHCSTFVLIQDVAGIDVRTVAQDHPKLVQCMASCAWADHQSKGTSCRVAIYDVAGCTDGELPCLLNDGTDDWRIDTEDRFKGCADTMLPVLLNDQEDDTQCAVNPLPVSYTHLTLPTIYSV